MLEFPIPTSWIFAVGLVELALYCFFAWRLGKKRRIDKSKIGVFSYDEDGQLSEDEETINKMIAELAKGEMLIFTRDQAGHLIKLASSDVVEGALWLTRKDNLAVIKWQVKWTSAIKVAWPVIILSMVVVYLGLNGGTFMDWLRVVTGGLVK